MFDALIESPWAPCLIWAALYVSDYYSTIAGARLYQTQHKIFYEGSYEITPIFQADVNALRRVSPRFLFILVASTAYLWWMRSLISPSDAAFGFYVMCLGSLFLLEVAVHVRHLVSVQPRRPASRGTSRIPSRRSAAGLGVRPAPIRGAVPDPVRRDPAPVRPRRRLGLRSVVHQPLPAGIAARRRRTPKAGHRLKRSVRLQPDVPRAPVARRCAVR
jgi:hypothetical protein